MRVAWSEAENHAETKAFLQFASLSFPITFGQNDRTAD